MSNNEQARQTVLAILKDHRIPRLSFFVSCYKIEAHFYPALAKAIQQRKVEVEYDASLKKTAAYNPMTNTIYLGFTRATHLEHKAAIVHECTHAICDQHKMDLMDQTESEMAAYIAQFMFIAADEHPANRINISFQKTGDDDHNFAAIANPAWRIAHSNLVNAKWGKVVKGWGGDKDHIALANAVRHSDLYAHKADEFVGYNGVG